MVTTRRSSVRAALFAAAVLAGAASAAVAAEPPKGKPVENTFGIPAAGGSIAAPADDLPPEAMKMHWQLGPYIKGSTTEVRDQIDGPLEGLLTKKFERTTKRDQLKADEAERSAKVVADLRKSSDSFRQTDDELTAARKAVLVAREGHDGTGMMAASGRVTKAEEAERAQVDAVLAKDPDVVANRQEVAKLTEQLSGLTDPIAKAVKGREQTMEGLRTSNTLPGPPQEGAKGLLMKIKPIKIVDASSFVGEYDAPEKIAEDTKMARPDGMQAFKMKLYRVHLLVTGIDTAAIKENTPVNLDETFQIKGKQTVGKTTCFVAEKVGGTPWDVFFAVVDPLKLPEGAEKPAGEKTAAK